MPEWKQETGDDILQVDTLKPEAAPNEKAMEEKADGLKRTTAGQDDRKSPPPANRPPGPPREPPTP
jgi:hypothetical protein